MLRAILIGFISFCVTTGLQATPVFWGGHAYEVVAGFNQDWNWAKTQAESRTFRGVFGTLAAITSAEENAFILGLQDDFNALPVHGYSIGGFQPDGSPEPGGNWQWVTGEAWDYENWAQGEPNNRFNDDVTIFYFDSPYVAPGGMG